MSNATGASSFDQVVGEALAALRDGLIVVYPTETFYGLAADPFAPAAMDRLLALKGRDAAKTVALIAADAVAAFALASEVSIRARMLADAFWPGPLTLVMPARGELHQALIGSDGGVGVRVSPHPVARALAAGLGRPITATSANLAGQPPSSTIAMARAAFGAKVSVYLDGGVLEAVIPSTLIACDALGWRILREGAITADQITAVLAQEE